jgi:hypothetical protein
MPQTSTSSKDTYVVATCRTTQSLMTLCSQEIFSVFLRKFLGYGTGLSTSDTQFTYEGDQLGIQHPTVNRLTELFVGNNLGSRADGLLCIIPIFASELYPNYVSVASNRMLQYMNESISSGAMVRDQVKVLRWGKRCMEFKLNDQQIWEWLIFSAWHNYEFGGLKTGGWTSDSMKRKDLLDAFSRTLDETKSRSDHLIERLYLHAKLGGVEAELFRDKGYGELRQTTFSECIEEDDPYGALILAYQICNNKTTVNHKVVDGLAQRVQRSGELWLLIAREIRKKRDIFSVCDEKGRNAFCRACLTKNLEAAKCISELSPRQYEEQTDMKGWRAFHHMIAGNHTNITMSVKRAQDATGNSLEDAEVLFEALGSDGVNLDTMIPFLQKTFGVNYQSLRNKFARYTIQMEIKKEKDWSEPWMRGLRRVYDYEQSLVKGKQRS